VQALIGQNGAGKSILIKVLTGFYHRDAGLVEFGGRPRRLPAPPRDCEQVGSDRQNIGPARQTFAIRQG
jgi:ribose transport system ATP-binding protein